MLAYCCLCTSLVLGVSSSAMLSSTEQNTTRQESRELEGGQASFQCDIYKTEPSQPLIILWRRGFTVLSTGPTLLTLDTRFGVEVGRGKSILSISNLRKEDAGEYVCQMTTMEGVREQSHLLTVLVAPSILALHQDSLLTARIGETVILRCNASGVPPPTIHWYKSVGAIPGEVSCSGSCYSIPHVDLAAGGDYICSASNGVGQPQHASIHVKILFPPSLSSPVSGQVQGGEGVEVMLECLVRGEPAPAVRWMRVGEEMVETEGIISNQVQEKTMSTWRHTLIFRNSSSTDYGNYSCMAENILGVDRIFMELHGRPSNPVFLPYYQDNLLTWSTISYYRVIMYCLLYRMVNSSSWLTETIPGGRQLHNISKTQTWNLQNFTASYSYECIVQAQNKYGWSLPSKIIIIQPIAQTEHYDHLPSSLVNIFSSTSIPGRSSLISYCFFIFLILCAK